MKIDRYEIDVENAEFWEFVDSQCLYEEEYWSYGFLGPREER